jgi:hypothetical protein
MVVRYYECWVYRQLKPLYVFKLYFQHNKISKTHVRLVILLILLFIHIFNSSVTGEKWEYNETIHQLFVDFQKAHDSVRREVLYNILIEFGVPMRLVRLIKMCLNEACSKVRTGKHLCDTFHIKMV